MSTSWSPTTVFVCFFFYFVLFFALPQTGFGNSSYTADPNCGQPLMHAWLRSVLLPKQAIKFNCWLTNFCLSYFKHFPWAFFFQNVSDLLLPGPRVLSSNPASQIWPTKSCGPRKNDKVNDCLHPHTHQKRLWSWVRTILYPTNHVRVVRLGHLTKCKEVVSFTLYCIYLHLFLQLQLAPWGQPKRWRGLLVKMMFDTSFDVLRKRYGLQ